MEFENAPRLIVVGGPNGSGKSTYAIELAENSGIKYIGADSIALEIAPENPYSARIEASRQFILRIRDSIQQQKSMVVESTLAGKSLRNLINESKSAGFSVTVVFVFLDSADRCVQRVKQRVKLGGHDVPEADIRRRYARSIKNFWNLYRGLADMWVMVYNSGLAPENVAMGTSDKTIVRIKHWFDFFQSIVSEK